MYLNITAGGVQVPALVFDHRECRRSVFAHMDTLQRGVQWIGGAVDWGSIT